MSILIKTSKTKGVIFYLDMFRTYMRFLRSYDLIECLVHDHKVMNKFTDTIWIFKFNN